MSSGLKVVVAGSRSLSVVYAVYDYISQTLNEFDIEEIVSGGAIGVDTLAEQYAKENDIPIKIFKPKYKSSKDRSAPLMRNIEMAKYGDILIAFHDGKSTGTKHMINQMSKLDKPVYVYYPLQ